MKSPLKICQESEISWSAIRENAIRNGYVCSELYYADIDMLNDSFVVRWQDKYLEKEFYSSFIEAINSISKNWGNHTPYENGVKYRVDEL